ncbi:MAG: hypothetical protein KGS72_25010 [Cyanobacteria bacterium REEB67]|nr:hypothetical protein [Cyanobacteria bacterium REEB67]
MDVLLIPGVQAILSLAAVSWTCSLCISLIALLFISPNCLRFIYPELRAVVGLLCLALVTVHFSTGHWLLF